MPHLQQFRLPDVGEGLTEAEIVAWRVKPGDVVAVNDIIVEIETAKSLVELPCPYAGVVADLLVDAGSTVDVGTPIIAVDTAPSDAAPTVIPPPGDHAQAVASPRGDHAQAVIPPPGDHAQAVAFPRGDHAQAVAFPRGDHAQAVAFPRGDHAEAVAAGLIGGPAPGGRTSVLVGYGPRTTEAKRRPRRGAVVPEVRAAAAAQEALHSAFATAEDAPAVPAEPPAPVARVLAKPPVRMLAKERGVDLMTVVPTGPGGIVTREDVLAAVRTPEVAAPPTVVPVTRAPVPSGGEERIPIRGVRKATAAAMVASAFTAPHVTEWVTVDVTRSMRMLERWRTEPDLAGVRLSPLVLVARALLVAVRRHPDVNSSWDEAAQEIVRKHDVNLGVAAATPRGLLVPNIKDAARLSLRELAEALTTLTATAREGRTTPTDLTGGTITITNVGVFGVDAGTPILNPGEAVILCVGAIREQPWMHKGKIRPRMVTQLALSFDHRLVDGELGSRFLVDVAAVLERPDRALMWG